MDPGREEGGRSRRTPRSYKNIRIKRLQGHAGQVWRPRDLCPPEEKASKKGGSTKGRDIQRTETLKRLTGAWQLGSPLLLANQGYPQVLPSYPSPQARWALDYGPLLTSALRGFAQR